MMNKFDPALYSIAENEFLLASVGTPSIVALKTAPSVGVNIRAVKPVLDRIMDLTDQEKHDKTPWCGLEAVRSAITTYLAQMDKWSTDQRRGAPRFPSTYTYDVRGRRFRSGPGSDSAAVKTYFAPDGTRKEFAVDLVLSVAPEWNPDWAKADEPKGGLVNNAAQTRIECFCGHTESYKIDSRQSYNAARARMSRHLRKATTDVDQHRETHTNEFGS